MHVKAKQVAIAGLLAAFSAVLMILSAVLESSSLFLIAAASFCVGITIREWGILFGAGYFAASLLVNLIVTPNKFYCATFAAMALYLLLSEGLWEKIAAKKELKNRNLTLWIGKYVIFNIIYIPILTGFSDLIFTKEVDGRLLLIGFLAGQAGIFIYDQAYRYFQGMIWSRLRGRLINGTE